MPRAIEWNAILLPTVPHAMPVRVGRPLLLAAIGPCAIIGGTDAHGQSVPSDTVVATTAPDAALEARLQGIYDQVTAFQDIEVRVRGGAPLGNRRADPTGE
jgi:hypothetical protein